MSDNSSAAQRLLFGVFWLAPRAGQSSLVTFVVVLSKYLLKPMPSSVVDTQLVTSVQSHTLSQKTFRGFSLVASTHLAELLARKEEEP